MKMEAGENPAALSIGVTGHRFLRDENVLRRGVTAALDQIVKIFPGRSITVLSPLAEGADRLVVDVIRHDAGVRLVAPLPLPRDDYLQDFATAESKREFLQMLERADEVIQLPRVSVRDAAYEAVGVYVLENSDILLALWDGEESRGRGGTAEIIARAVESGKPVAHIWAGNNAPDENKRTDVGEKHGQIRWFNLPGE